MKLLVRLNDNSNNSHRIINSISITNSNNRSLHNQWRVWSCHSRATRITQDQTGPVLHSFCHSVPEIFFFKPTYVQSCPGILAGQVLTPKPKQVLFVFFLRKSFAGIPRNFSGRVLSFRWAFRFAFSLYFCYDINIFAKQ